MCQTPDDLSDVDLDHPAFRAAFPDGRVPIREVPTPRAGAGDGFLSWAENVLTVKEHAEHYDVDALAFHRERLINYEVLGGNKGIELTKLSQVERKTILSELMQRGLTLRQCARYLDWTPERVVATATSEKIVDRAEGVLAADEALAVEAEPHRLIAARYGLSVSVVQGLARLRVGEPYQPACARSAA